MTNVVVVGASVSGALAAKSASLAGASVTILEEDKQPGKFYKCSGVVSKKGLNSLGVNYSPSVLHEIYGANIYSSSGKKFTVKSKEVVAFVLNRQSFDEICAKEAIQAGAKLKLNSKVVSKNSNSVICKDGRTFNFDFLIGADGASSTVAKLYNFPAIKQKNFAMCYEAEFQNATVENENLADVFLDQELFFGFFGWAIPVGRNKVRLGFGTVQHLNFEKRRLKFLEKYLPIYGASKSCSKCREFWHLIPLKVRSETQQGNVFLVGDAAGQTKSSSGGGVVFGGNCAKIAGEIAARNETSYEKKWREKYGRVLNTHLGIRKTFNLLPNAVVNLAVIGFDKLLLSNLLSNFGDMDYVVKI